MINTLQVLVSVPISEKKVDENEIDDHMKLFMSTELSLHKDYGYLGFDTTVENRRSDKESIRGLLKGVCQTIIKKLGMTSEPKVSEMKKQIKKFTIAKLRGYFGEKFPKKEICSPVKSN